MRKFVATLLSLSLAVFLTLDLAQAQMSKPSGKKMTVEGELVDLRCFSAMGARGEDHEMCANACAKAGDPVGIVDAKGNVYTLGSITTGYNGHMAKTARIEGELFGNVLIPKKVEVKDGDKWTAVKLPKEMM